jgi:hypothetical protein
MKKVKFDIKKVGWKERFVYNYLMKNKDRAEDIFEAVFPGSHRHGNPKKKEAANAQGI